VALSQLLDDAPAEGVTLKWLIGKLEYRSFGVVLLFLALLGMLPGVSVLAGVMLLVPAIEMILAHRRPMFPQRIGSLHFKTRRVAAIIDRTVPVLHCLERFVRPRWQFPLEVTKRAVGILVLVLGLTMFIPIPLSNIPPAILIILTAVAYLEKDGVLLCAAAGATFLLLAGLTEIAWQTASVLHL
jgi:hypothetical protein